MRYGDWFNQTDDSIFRAVFHEFEHRAEHLGLRTRAELLAAIGSAGLRVKAHMDVKPVHAKSADTTDPLHAARAAEITSLWRLAAVEPTAVH